MVKRNIHLLFAVLFISVLAYSGTLSNGFVFDDNSQVLQNRWISDPSSLKKVFFSSVWDFEGGSIAYNSYRPLIHVAYISVYRFFGLDPAAYHALNVVLHAMNAALVFITASVLVPKPSAGAAPRPYAAYLPFFAATIFALHPAGAEAVSWVACVTELLYTLFFLLSFLAFIGTGTGRAAFLSAALFFIALLSKETALVLPLVLFAYDRCGERGVSSRAGGLVRRYGPFAVAIVIYLLLRAYALGGMAPGQSKHPYLNAYQVLLNVPLLMAGYMRFLVIPSDLTVFHVFAPVFGLNDLRLLVSVAVLVAMAFVFVKTFRSDKQMFFSLTLMVAPLLPVMYIPGIGRNPFAERYMYLPIAGFALSLLFLSGRLLQKATTKRAWSAFALGATLLVAVYALTVVTRIPDWRDDAALWMSAIEQDPANYYAMNELAGLLLERKAYDEAADIARRSVEMNSLRPAPDTRILGRAHFTTATALRLKGLDNGKADERLLEGAIIHYNEALKAFRAKSDLKSVYNDLGGCQMVLGRTEDAVRSFEAALRLAPDDKVLSRNLQIARKSASMGERAPR